MASPQPAPNPAASEVPEYLTWDYASQPVIIQVRSNLVPALHRASPENPADGFLFGVVVPGDRPTIRIDLCLPAQSGYFEEGDTRNAERLPKMLAGFRSDKSRSQVVGYFRSRSLSDPEPTNSEFELMRTHFSSATDVLLVIDVSPDKFTMEFFVWVAGQLHLYSPHSQRRASRSAPKTQLWRSFVAKAPSLPKPFWLAGAVAAALFTFATLLYRPAMSAYERWRTVPEREAQLNLSVDRSGPDYLLSWSREVARRYAGSTATLLIDDDGQRRIIPIGHELLSTGRVLYAPKSPDVLFRLTIAVEPGREIGESVQTIASARATSAQPAPVLEPVGTRTRTSEPPPKKVYLPVTAPFRNNASSRMSVPPARPFDTSTVRQARVPIPRIADVAAPDAAQLHGQRQADIASVAAPVQSIGSIPRPAAPPVTVPAPQATAPYNAPATPVTTLPRVLRQVPLSTPPEVRKLIREDITISVNATVDSAGQVTAAQALAKGSYIVTTLARAAEENARRWLFAPATVNGQAVPSKFVIEYKVKANR